MANITSTRHMELILQKSGILLLVSMLLVFFTGSLAWAESWPREFSWNGGSMQVFQPEIDAVRPRPESGSGALIEARAALSIRRDKHEEPLFAAIRFEADTFSANDASSLLLENIHVVDIRFSKQDEGEQTQLITLVEDNLANITLEIKSAQEKDSIDVAASHEEFNLIKAEPPRIILSGTPAILVFIDGEPITEAIEDTELRRVVNTPFTIIANHNSYYLAASPTLWYRASHALGPWVSIDNPAFDVPANVLALINVKQENGQSDNQPYAQENPEPAAYPRPVVIVATEPTELIIYDGVPSWSPLEGMNLLYMSNTENDVFLDIESSQNYVLLGGRWYKGRVGASDVPWQPVANDALPDAFQNIDDYLRAPEVMTHIAGTQQARDALLDNTLPRASAVNRDDTNFSAEWDGNPRFETVRGTRNLQYALNTPAAIFKYNSRYYACEDGIWYTSSSPWGNWSIATRVPDIIYDIPASNPHHNVTYVRVYDATPEVVYVGYTPGYLGSYAYHGSIVYGTGWRYRPWSSGRYYARPATWGFNAYYDAWNGWAYSAGLFDYGYSFAFNNYRYRRHSYNYPSYGHRRDRRHGKPYRGNWTGTGGHRRHEPDNSHPRHRLVDRDRRGDGDHARGNDRDRDRDRNRNRNFDRDNSHERDRDNRREDRGRGNHGGNAGNETGRWVADSATSTLKPPRLAPANRAVNRPKHNYSRPDKSRNQKRFSPEPVNERPAMGKPGIRTRTEGKVRDRTQHRTKPSPKLEGLRNVDERQLNKVRDNVKKYVARNYNSKSGDRADRNEAPVNRKVKAEKRTKRAHTQKSASNKRAERAKSVPSKTPRARNRKESASRRAR